MNAKLNLFLVTFSLSTFLANNSMDERPKKRICLEEEYRKRKSTYNWRHDVRIKDFEFIEEALRNGADPNFEIDFFEGSNLSYTGLHYVIKCYKYLREKEKSQQALNIIRLLLKSGADINLEDTLKKRTFLELAKESDDEDILKIIKEWQEETNKKILEETSPYMPPVLGNIVSEYVTGKLEQ